MNTINPTIYAATVLLILCLYMAGRMLRADYVRRKIERKQLLGLLDIVRYAVVNAETSKSGKGIIPAQVWTNVQMGASLTGHIKTR